MTISTAPSASTGNRPAVSGRALIGLQLLIIAVFFLFGGIGNLNDVLIPKLKGLFQLSYAQAMLVQFAFLTSYAIFSIPAGMLLNRLGYLRGLVLGFAIMAVACLLFLPAAWSGLYGSFLAALFVLGAGITLLQVAVNPLIILLGDPATAHSRLTFAQLFNSLGVFMMIRFGAQLLLGAQSTVDPATLSGAALDAHRLAETSIIGEAYIGLAIVLALIAAFFWLWRGALDKESVTKIEFRGIFGLLRRPRLAFGCLCIFLYVGAEVSIASLMINYLGEPRTLALDPPAAGVLLSYYWLGALIGRLIGAFLLRAVTPGRLLALVGAAALTLVLISALTTGHVAAWSLIAVGLANSIMFPTIFSLATEGMADDAPRASGLLCTAIVGGAIVPLCSGTLADFCGLAVALIIPMGCYLVITGFGLWTTRQGASA
jgi:FHS family L-fucose permease-like MFS transporter